MKWANFLHIYQPAEQQPLIMEAVANQSYRPLLKGFLARPSLRFTMNVTGALLEQFDHEGMKDLIRDLRELVGRGQLELTGSAKYHAFLPLLDESDVQRQIEQNSETLRFYLGKELSLKGFFPPEMAYSPGLENLVKDFGFEWVLLDEISLNGQPDAVDWNQTYAFPNGLRLVFRQRRASNLIMSAMVRSSESFKEAAKDDLESSRYVVTGMDGETFGHHRPGMDETLFDILENSGAELVHVSDLFKLYPDHSAVKPVAATWASSAEDIGRGIQFLSWSDPSNEIHSWQWEFVSLALKLVRALPSSAPHKDELDKEMDRALASDHFWWASAKPWWSVEMIEAGAHRLLQVIRSVPGVSADELSRAAHLYEKIVSTAFHWQRNIHERMKEQRSLQRIPFRERTLGSSDPGETGIFHAFMDMMRRLEKEAVDRGEYEKAILWRDAAIKLEKGNDIYDTVNAIDLLRLQIPNSEVEEILDRYTEKYKRIRGGQPEQRGA